MKKKLIAAVTSLVMVATLAPSATVFADTNTASTGTATAVTAEEVTVTSVVDLIKAIGATKTYSAEQKARIENARAAYEKLSDFDKQSVGSYYTTLTAAERTYEGYAAKLKAVEDAIDNVGDTVVAKDYEKDGVVTKAKTAVGGLSSGMSITNIDKARAEKYAALTDQDSLKNAIDAIDAIAAIDTDMDGTPDGITESNFNEQSTANLIAAAKTAYDTLSPAQKTMAGNYAILDLANRTVTKYTNAVNLNGLLDVADFKNTIGTGENEVSVEKAQAAYDAANEAYKALSETLKGKATAAKSKLDARAKKITNYNTTVASKAAVDAVTAKIKALPEASDVTLADEAAIKDAAAAYGKLTVAQKQEISDSHSSKLEEVQNALTKKIEALSTAERAKRVTDLIAKLPATTAEVTRADKATAEAARVEYNTGTAQMVVASGKINGTPDDWQKAIGDSEITRLQAALQFIAAAEKTDKDTLSKLAASEAYAAVMSVTTPEELEAAKKAVANAEKALSDANSYVKEDFAAEKYNTQRENLATTKQAIADYEGKTSEENKAAAKNIIEAMKGLPSAASIKADDLATVKAAVDPITKDYEAANIYVKAMVEADATVWKYYQAVLSQIKTLEDQAAAPEIVAMIKNLTIIAEDADKATIDAARAANKTARANLEALSDDQQALVSNVSKLAQAEAAVDTAIKNLIDKEIAKIGNITADLSAAQIDTINTITALVNEYGVDLTNEPTYPTYTKAKEKLDQTLKDQAEKEAAAVNTGITNLPATIDKTVSESVVALYEQYQALSDAAKAKVTAEDAAKLSAAYDKAIVLILDKAEITVDASQIYTGSEVKPAVIVKDAKGAIIDAAQYEVYYDNNVSTGTATVAVVPTENSAYTGTVKATFEIKAAAIENADISGIAAKTYTGKAQTQAVKVVVNGRTLEENTDYTVAYKDNTQAGTATVTITAKGNYTGTVEKTFEIKAAAVKSAKVSGIAAKTYTGKARTQAVKVVVNGKTLVKGTDYTVTYKNNKNVGKATVTITAKGNYTGTITKTFIVKPAKETITSLKKGTKKFTVKYKKQAGASYQIYYKTSGSKAKTVKTSSVSKTIKKLKGGKTYTVKVRAYKKIDGKTYYGSYSKAKKVKVRK
ncbi:hypothetical protein LI177_12535 [bacterium 210820-DFI.6.37]|nr:hypothetical protein [bacterium 210820-DFI.6.37]